MGTTSTYDGMAREQFIDCGCDVKNDRIGLWWVRVFVAEVNDILSSLLPPLFNELVQGSLHIIPWLCTRESHFDDLAKDMGDIPSDAEIPGRRLASTRMASSISRSSGSGWRLSVLGISPLNLPARAVARLGVVGTVGL